MPTSPSLISDIIQKELGEECLQIERMVIGICNEVYTVTTASRKVILRLNEWPAQLSGVEKHIALFTSLGIKVPAFITSDYTKKKFPLAYQILSYIEGQDLGLVIETMSEPQLETLAREIASIFKKLAPLPTNGKFGWVGKDESGLVDSWAEIMKQTEVEKRNDQTGVVGAGLVQKEKELFEKYLPYFESVHSTLYFDDIASKNVLIKDGVFSGLIDLNEVTYGDPLEAVGSIKASWYGTRYGDFYTKAVENELELTTEQRKMVTVYALFNRILWLSEAGITFNENTTPDIDHVKVEKDKKVIEALFTEANAQNSSL